MTQELNEDTLGIPIRHWLTEQGISVSGESETTGGSAVQMSKRTWDDGSGNKRTFEYHLKPNEGTSPDRCVRHLLRIRQGISEDNSRLDRASSSMILHSQI